MTSGLRFVEVPPTRQEESLAAVVLDGLSQSRKKLPSRFFYDTTGSRLFERITQLPEYYLTRCETEILQDHAKEIVADVDDIWNTSQSTSPQNF
jgi:L-histidine N-alpha-methyltransferase